SWSARVTFDPTPNWSSQISIGELHDPEGAAHGDVRRTTASVSYSRKTTIGQLDSSVIFGRNETSGDHAHDVNSWLAESVLQFGGRNYVTGRAEIVDKDELFEGADVPHSIEHGVFQIKALTLGYTRDLLTTRTFTGALGGNVTLYSIPEEIEPYYGEDLRSLYLFFRVRMGNHAM
ncbi:MAG: hypothetical protein M3Q69_20575, partial [Acidobacteriota bacterium]|nr:hypothetical protein [Acidobacteriota bacterium]